MTNAKPGKTTRYSVCPYNCWPVNCGIAVTTNGEEIVEISGNPHHDFNRGMLCVKGQSCGEVHASPDRLTHPLVREGERGENRWRRATWDEVLDRIAERMLVNIADGRRQANALYHSHGNIVQRINWKILTPRFANMCGLTRWDGDFPCWYDVGVAQELTGYWGLHDAVETGKYANGLINWAQDPCASQANMVPYITQLRERGKPVITIDPRITQTAAISDIHIRPRLGSDVWLANAVAHILIRENCFDHDYMATFCHGFEEYRAHIEAFTPGRAATECELPLTEIEKLAEIYSTVKPLCTNLTRGALGKHNNGIQMVRAILCLIPLSGNAGIRGGGAIWGESVDWNLDLRAEDSRPAADYPVNNFSAIDAALDAGEVDVFLVVGGNPLSQWPNRNRLLRQLRNVGMVVVNDLFINHTAREVGDIILPATSWLEELGLRTSNSRIYLMDRVCEPKGECREVSNWMTDLAKRLGVQDYFPWENKEACLDACLDSPACQGATVDKLRNAPGGLAATVDEIPYANGEFQSPTGKFELYSTKAVDHGLAPLPEHVEPLESRRATPERAKEYPLQLISARRNTHFHSFHNSHSHIATLNAIEPGPVLFMHPKDAVARGLQDGDYAELFNDRGCGVVRIEITTEVAPGDISLNDCWPELNMVTPAHAPCPASFTAEYGVGGQPSYQNALVQVKKAG